MIASESDAADGRGVRVSLTAAGRLLQRRIGRQHARSVASTMTAALSRDEIRELEAICLKLAAGRAGTAAMKGGPRP